MKLKLRLYLIKNDVARSANYDSDFMAENYDGMFNFFEFYWTWSGLKREVSKKTIQPTLSLINQ